MAGGYHPLELAEQGRRSDALEWDGGDISSGEPAVFDPGDAGAAAAASAGEATAVAQLCSTGVDESCSVVLSYESGALATTHCTVSARTPAEAQVIGEDGWIRIHAPFYAATAATRRLSNGEEEEVQLPLSGNGYNYQAAAVMECLRAGELESSVMPLDESLAIMQLLDRLRAQISLVYPGE